MTFNPGHFFRKHTLTHASKKGTAQSEHQRSINVSASLCFIAYLLIYSTIPLLTESKCSRLRLVSVAMQSSLSILVKNPEGRFFRETF